MGLVAANRVKAFRTGVLGPADARLVIADGPLEVPGAYLVSTKSSRRQCSQAAYQHRSATDPRLTGASAFSTHASHVIVVCASNQESLP